VLFLFVVMMLDVDSPSLRQGILQYLPVGFVVGFIFMAELVAVGAAWVIRRTCRRRSRRRSLDHHQHRGARPGSLQTEYVYYFQAAGIVLLIAMIGAIVLTLRHKPGVKRQNIADQVARNRETAIEVVKVQPGQGL